MVLDKKLGPEKMNSINHTIFAELNQKLEGLLKLCQQLRQENRMLCQNEQVWKQERSALIEKNELARSKIESMITRLKTLE